MAQLVEWILSLWLLISTLVFLSLASFITDMFTIVLGFLIYGIEQTLIGTISVWIGSVMINKTMLLELLLTNYYNQ